MSTFDTIIRGGTITCGLRRGRFVGDVGISDGKSLPSVGLLAMRGQRARWPIRRDLGPVVRAALEARSMDVGMLVG